MKKKIILYLFMVFTLTLGSLTAAADSAVENSDELNFKRKCISTHISGGLYRKLIASFQENDDGEKYTLILMQVHG